MLISAPTGISWSIIPFPKATSSEQLAEQTNICHRATGIVNGYCNQVLRSTVDTEVLSGPDYRVTVEQSTGNARIILARWPVIQVLAMQTASNAIFPRQWNQVPNGYFDVEYPIIGTYNSSTPSSAGEGGQSVLLGPGYLTWALGRRGYRVSTSYINGWPHTGSMVANTAGATTMHVDDVTGFAGASATVYDGTQTEQIHVVSVTATTPLVLPNGGGLAQAGPGTLTLSSPLLNDHDAGIVISSLPQSIIWASILAASSQALEAGITSISIQNLPGSMTTGGHGVSDMKIEYEMLLEPYRRVI
jgi:hypothetical protein